MTDTLPGVLGYAAAMTLSLLGDVQTALLVLCTLLPLAIYRSGK